MKGKKKLTGPNVEVPFVRWCAGSTRCSVYEAAKDGREPEEVKKTRIH